MTRTFDLSEPAVRPVAHRRAADRGRPAAARRCSPSSLAGLLARSAHDYRSARLAEAGQVRHLDRHLLADARVDLHLPPGLAQDAARCRLATAAVFVLEVVLIDMQAWRGTTSHFNVGTPLDAAVFGIMGGAIVVADPVGVAVAVALWRQRFADERLAGRSGWG